MYPQLPVPDPPEYLLDLWVPCRKTSFQNPAQSAQPDLRTPTSPEKVQLPVLTSLSLEDLQRALRPDLQAKGIQAFQAYS